MISCGSGLLRFETPFTTEWPAGVDRARAVKDREELGKGAEA